MNATDILKKPSLAKGIARLADLFGALDEYKFSTDPDSELLGRDWQIVGDDLQRQMKEYERQAKSSAYQI